MADHIAPTRSHGLVEILDRVLDKGLVIAGDIKINLANVELLTIQVRLLICSIDKAEQIGLNWWRHDPRLTAAPTIPGLPPGALETRLDRIERRLEELTEQGTRGRIHPTSPPSTE
ncbi:MAG: gas vesicle protein [Gemmatimonadota bacterium]|nr:gas vesicle protein [Gemmatimonadota bacterium]